MRIRRQGLAEGDDGVTLVEVLVALLMLAVVSVSTGAVFVGSLRTTTEQTAQQRAVSVATRAIETVQSVPASQVLVGRRQAAVQALLSSAVMAPLVAQDVTATDNFDTAATLGSVAVIPLQREELLEGKRYTVRTAINTCYLSRALQTCGSTVGTDGVRTLRATVNVTWGEADCRRCTYSASALVDKQLDPVFKLAQSVPIIQNVTPSSVTSGTTTPVTIVGAVFQTGAQVTLAAGGGSVSGAVRSTDGTTFTATWAAGTTPGSYVLTVTNPDGGSATFSLTVTAPAPPPVVTSVSPSSVERSTSQNLTISGTDFGLGVTVALPGAAGTLTNVVRVNDTLISATWAAGPTTGPYTLTVRNPDARQTTATLNVTPPPLSNPAITSVSPASAARSTARTITITGSDFRSGLNLAISSGGGTLSNVNRASATSVTATLTTTATAGNYTLTLTNPDGRTATAAVTTTVPSSPTISALSPSSVPRNGTRTIVITGADFRAGATVTVGGGNGSTVTSVTVNSSTSITVTLSIANGNVTGTRTLSVRNTDGVSSAARNFTVTQ